jgi:secreted PhoX family phosphatase
VEAEGTGPYFSPDGSTLFINVQHPGEETRERDGARFGDPLTYSSWWPGGNRTAGTGRPGVPQPSTMLVTREHRRRGRRSTAGGAVLDRVAGLAGSGGGAEPPGAEAP